MVVRTQKQVSFQPLKLARYQALTENGWPLRLLTVNPADIRRR
jgi:hypothetical protein